MALLSITARAHLEIRPDAFAGSELARARQIDAAAIAAITELYREVLPPGGAILDLMSGWVSHLPPEIPYSRVVGVGLNSSELAENPFLDEWHVQDLNCDPHLPFATAEFDGAAICVAVQHLTRPCEVIRDAGRSADRDILKPLRSDARYRVLVPARRRRAPLPDCPTFRASRELGRHSLPRPDAARRWRSALRGDWAYARCRADD